MSVARPDDRSERLNLPPAHAADRLARWDRPAFLESGPGFGSLGRSTILAACPTVVFEAVDERWLIHHGFKAIAGTDPFRGLERLLELCGLAHLDTDLANDGFRGGLIGFLSYDLAPRIERLPRARPRDSRLPDIRLALYDTAVLVDHDAGAVTLHAFDYGVASDRPSAERIAMWRTYLAAAADAPNRSRLGALRSNFDRDEYIAAVRRCREYIAAGDVFQVNLSQRFEADGDHVPYDLYSRLRRRSPAPYAAYLAWDDLAVVSASPESFYATFGDRIVTRPIKGTRPRGRDADIDSALRSELLASPKDRAELTMIVDLERNDLGRVCRYGSVRVREALAVESYAQVHHLVATVEGTLRRDTSPIEVIKAVFPGGSITGAPKIRAMQIIDELEPHRRSLYTGSVGYISRGSTAFNIAIRTMLVEGDRVTFGVGGGIVADSDPEAEYEETLHKGRGLRETLEEAP